MLGHDAEAAKDVATLAEKGLDVSELEEEIADLGSRR